MANLPITTLRLKADIADTLEVKGSKIDVSTVVNFFNVNGNGLDPTYCAGADASARLNTLRTLPYEIGRFRNYDHTASTSYSTVFIISMAGAQRGDYIQGWVYLVRDSDLSTQDSYYVDTTSSDGSEFTASFAYRINFGTVNMYNAFGDSQLATYTWSEINTSSSGSGGLTRAFSEDTMFELTVTKQ